MTLNVDEAWASMAVGKGAAPMKVSTSLDSERHWARQREIRSELLNENARLQEACARLRGLPTDVQINQSYADLQAMQQAQALLQSRRMLSMRDSIGVSHAFRPPPGLDLPTQGALGESSQLWNPCGAASTCSTSEGSSQESDDTDREFEVLSARRTRTVRHTNPDKTTVLMQNIPNRHNRDMLQAIINEAGFRGTYDFLYLPADFRTKVSFGYAFLNFLCQAEAERFMQHFNGFSSWGSNSTKVCSVIWSEAQSGLESLFQKYRNCTVMHASVPDEFKPILLQKGERIDFPAPTTRVRKPRLPGQQA